MDDKTCNLELLEKGEAGVINPAYQNELLSALKKKDFEGFKRLLPFTDINHFYPPPDTGTGLYIATSKGLLDFVELLVEQGADVNGYNNIRKDTPLHAACKEARPEIVKLLLEHGANSSEKDKFGRQPLHVLGFIGKDKYKDEHLQCLKILLDSGACMNTQDRSGSTALHLALIKNNAQVAETLISYGANPDINPSSGESVRELILKQLPSSYAILPPPGKTNEGNIERQLFRCMYNKDLKEFKRLLLEIENKGINVGKISDGSYNLLQYACEYEGLEGFITVLLENPTVDPNGTCTGEKWKPLLLAAMQGNHNALRLIIAQDKTDLTVVDELRKETALHKAARMEKGSTEDMNYLQSIEILIGAIKSKGSDKDPLLHKRLNIDAVDAFGNTALHYAARNLDRGSREAEKIVSALLRAGAYVGIRNHMGEPGISRVTPSLLEDYLDECIGTNDEPPCEERYVLTFNYSMLIPPCSVSNDPNREADLLENSALFKETEPLSYICNNKEYQNLLKHPIITSFLYLKWHRIRGIFLVNLFFYVLFVAFITAYILGVYGSDPPDDLDEKPTSMGWIDACSALSVIFLTGLALRELFQFVMSPLLYIQSLENLLEIAVIVLSVTMIFSSLDHEIKQHLAAVIILFVWIELVLLIGRHPKLSTYITMFTAVSWNFLKFLLWYALFIIAFALSFFILFRQGKKSEKGEPDQAEEEEDNFFANAGGAMLKTAVMLTGEFDFSDLPLETFKITSHLVFLLFLFLIAVVLLNLLNGLAVSDTQEVKDKAELVGYKSRVLLVSHVESMLLGKKLRFLNKLKSCFHSNESKSPVSVVERNSLCPSIMIFPEITTIDVMVNAGGKIMPRCCTSRNTCNRSCSMDPRVIEAARSIVAKRTRHTKIDEIDRRLQVIEECLKTIQSVILGKKLENACS